MNYDFDAVVTDLVMPGQEGIETLLELHRRRPHLPVIAMAESGHSSYLHTAKLLGARNGLIKPFSADEVLAVVRDAIGRFGSED